MEPIVKASVTIIGVVIAFLATAALFMPQITFAGDNQEKTIARNIKFAPEHRYDIKIYEFLDLQKDFGNPASAHRTLDDLFVRIKKKTKPRAKYNKEQAIKALKVIGQVFKEEGNFEYRKNNILIEGLKKQKNGRRFIDCDDYSSLYLLAGEGLGLSLKPVYASNHIFLVCNLDDVHHFYWEPTIGEERDVGFYRRWLNLPEDSGFPKILNEKEFEAVQFCNLGVAWYERGDYEKAVEFSQKAVSLNPGYVAALNNLGVAYAKQGKFTVALECYEKATCLEPHYGTAFYNIGVTFYKLGDQDKAIEYFKKAFVQDPKHMSAYHHETLALLERSENDGPLDLLGYFFSSSFFSGSFFQSLSSLGNSSRKAESTQKR
jgi:tetratricopeptide (TPR) repeat protein